MSIEQCFTPLYNITYGVRTANQLSVNVCPIYIHFRPIELANVAVCIISHRLKDGALYQTLSLLPKNFIDMNQRKVFTMPSTTCC